MADNLLEQEVLEEKEVAQSETDTDTQPTVSTTTETTTDETQTSDKKKKKRTATVPQTELDILAVANDLVKVWDEDELKIKWVTKAEFVEAVTKYNENIDVVISHKGSRSPQVKEISNLDKEINTHISKIKGALAAKFGNKDKFSHFADFGIERDGNVYVLPLNRDQRLKALQTLVVAIDNYELALYDYGKEYWQDVLDKYTQLSNEIRGKSGDISHTVIEKNNMKTMIVKVLNAVINGLKMNYPDDYRQEMRKWGFQKDKY